MSSGGYRKWAAILHEIVRLLRTRAPSLRTNNLITALLAHTFSDWTEWKTEQTLQSVDEQIAAIHKTWAAADPSPVVSVSEDLMGELRIHAPWLETPITPDTNER